MAKKKKSRDEDPQKFDAAGRNLKLLGVQFDPCYDGRGILIARTMPNGAAGKGGGS